MPGNGQRGDCFLDLLSALLFFFQEGDRQKMDPGRAGAFFLGDSGSYDVPIFILLRLWKPELPCGGGIRGRGFVVETLVL